MKKNYTVKCITKNNLNLKSALFFMNEDDEFGYNADGVLKHMKENNLNSMDVYLGKPIHEVHFFFCKFFQLMTEKGQGTCGRQCEGYQATNNVSGKCINYGMVYERTDHICTFKLNTPKNK